MCMVSLLGGFLIHAYCSRQTAEKGKKKLLPSARSCSSTRVRKSTHASRSSGIGGRMGSQLISNRTHPPRVSHNFSAMLWSSMIQTHRMSCTTSITLHQCFHVFSCKCFLLSALSYIYITYNIIYNYNSDILWPLWLYEQWFIMIYIEIMYQWCLSCQDWLDAL